MASTRRDVTGLLQAWGGGDPTALDQLVPGGMARAWPNRELGES